MAGRNKKAIVTTRKMNEEIASFMNLEPIRIEPFKFWPDPTNNQCSNSGLQYHKTLTWLLPVVNTINQISQKEFHYVGKEILIFQKERVTKLPIITPILKIHQRVYNFILWYKKQKKYDTK